MCVCVIRAMHVDACLQATRFAKIKLNNQMAILKA